MIVNSLYAKEYTAINEIDEIVLYELEKELKTLRAIGEVYMIIKENKTIIVL